MKLEFRFLALEDLPAIKELSNSMDMRNDPKIGETAEGIINDPMCDLYGAFSSEGKLVGIGGLRTLAKQYVWIEDVRIHGEYQKMGVGTKIFSYGEELARKRNYRIVAYQTVTENVGSCRIGEKLGFERSHEMTAFYTQEKEKLIVPEDCPMLEPIHTKEALSIMKKIPGAPREEICIGWAYRPLIKEIFEKNSDMNFFIHKEAVALEVKERNAETGEILMVKAIIYGNEKNVLPLLHEIRKRNVVTRWFLCLVPKSLEPSIEKIGFKYATVWTVNKNIVVLFKKYL